jgi:hypothetical protein
MVPSIGKRPLVVTLVVPTVGLVVGIVAGLLWWPEQVAYAAVHGLAFGAVALVLLVPLIVTLSTSSRPRSLVDATDRLTTWSYAGAIACVTSVLTLPQWKPMPACVSDPLQAIVSTSLAAALAVFAGVLLVLHARRSQRLLAEARCTVDIGIDDAELALLPTAYRHARFPPAVLHAARYQAIVNRRVRAGLVCATLSLLLAFVGVGARVVDVMQAGRSLTSLEYDTIVGHG